MRLPKSARTYSIVSPRTRTRTTSVPYCVNEAFRGDQFRAVIAGADAIVEGVAYRDLSRDKRTCRIYMVWMTFVRVCGTR
jgi:hypothetical protein